MRTILLIDDDTGFRAFLEETLTNYGYKVLTASDGKTGIEKAVLEYPDAVLLDLKMPGIDGKEVCLCLSNNPSTRHIPIIIITGEEDICDEAEGLKIGAVDYLNKPVKIEVLRARLEKVIEVAPAAATKSNGSEPIEDTINVGRLTLHLLKHMLTVDNNEVRLTPTEFKILTVLMRNPGHVISPDDMVNEVWDYKISHNMKSLLDNHLRNIRKKFGSCNDYLQNVYGQGYLVKEPDGATQIS